MVEVVILFVNFTFQFGGMKEGDFIVSIGDKDVKWAAHEQVVKLIKEAGDSLTLKLVTPMDRNYLKVSYLLVKYLECALCALL